eukprot:COSAG06_NODE_4125_length_4545_cov_30.309862_3_plen_75_part_00
MQELTFLSLLMFRNGLKVRKKAYSAVLPLYNKTPNICQDRLGTNIGKVEKETVFRRLIHTPRLKPCVLVMFAPL